MQRVVIVREEKLAQIRELIKDVPNFPKEGVMFKDLTPVLADGEAFQNVIQILADSFPKDADKIVAIESRGFIFGAALAHHLGVGLVLVRKPGKLPRETHVVEYELEYGSDCLHVHKEDLSPGDRVVIIDDVLATGGTAGAVESLCEKAGAEVLKNNFIIEISFLKGAERLRAPVESLVSY